MYFKKFKKTLTILLLAIFIMPLSVGAYSEYLIAGGENIGIELKAKGIMVVGSYKVNNSYPAMDAGLRVGDMIVSVNKKQVNTINQMINIINTSTNKDTVLIDYLRENKNYSTTLKLHKDNDIYKTGLYVKDSILGVGTLSYIDPNYKTFGALGHEIIDRSTGQILEIRAGTIFESIVTGIQKSSVGSPGGKNARFIFNNVTGKIIENTTSGIFGDLNIPVPNKKLYKVAQPDEIKMGEAQILTVLDGSTINAYKINIIKINKNATQKTKNLLFEINDQELLSKTGGIIQGMSGSPIIQGDNIIGAITHVVVDNPIRGYGIFITNMLEEAEN
jgi:stage IV sporulation protein B